MIALLCFLGMFALLGALLPLPAIVPILLYIGLLIGAQAFQEVPKAARGRRGHRDHPEHRVVGDGLMNNALSAAGTSAAKVGEEALANAGLVYEGTELLGGGAILAGLVLGRIVAFIIDKEFLAAAVYCFVGAVLGVHRADPRRAGGLERRRPDRARATSSPGIVLLVFGR